MGKRLVSISKENYTKICKEILMSAGVPEDHAQFQTESLFEADIRGIGTHGIFRLARYIEQITNGYINPQPMIKPVNDGSLVQVLDGDHGLGAVVGSIAMQEAIKKSTENGVGVVGVRKSNHFGIAAYFAEMASRVNQIGIVFTNASPSIAPTGSLKNILGNNPWSISVPSNLDYPITLDIANSIVARGKMRVAAQQGEKIPLGWGLNNKGEPTTDPMEAIKGTILPIGDYKGYGITLMIEILAGVLTGAGFGEKMVGLDANEQRNVGHLFISLNVENFMPIDTFKEKMKELTQSIKNAPRVKEEQEILLPGEKEWQQKLKTENEPIEISEETYHSLEGLCEKFNIILPNSLA